MTVDVYGEAIKGEWKSTEAKPEARAETGLPARVQPSGGTAEEAAATAPPERTSVAGKTWVLVVTRDRPELTRRTFEALFSSTSAAFEAMVIDNGSQPETLHFLTGLLASGRISRLILNRDGTVPQWQKSYSIAQGFHLLAEEVCDYFAWLDNDIEVQPGWLETAVRILSSTNGQFPIVSLCNDAEQDRVHPVAKEMHIAGCPVKLKKTSNGALWVMKRSFFSKFGLPPIGMGITNMGVEDWHYSRLMQQSRSFFAVVDGLARHLGTEESAREKAYVKG